MADTYTDQPGLHPHILLIDPEPCAGLQQRVVPVSEMQSESVSGMVPSEVHETLTWFACSWFPSDAIVVRLIQDVNKQVLSSVAVLGEICHQLSPLLRPPELLRKVYLSERLMLVLCFACC